MSATTTSSSTALPAYDFRIDLQFKDKELVFVGEQNFPVTPDGSFTVQFPASGVTRRILFVCDPNDPLLSLKGIRVAQPGRSVTGARLHEASGPIDDTPFDVEITREYILLEDTPGEVSEPAKWPYCLAFQHGSFETEQDPEILNEGGAESELERRRRARWLYQRRNRRRPVFSPR